MLATLDLVEREWTGIADLAATGAGWFMQKNGTNRAKAADPAASATNLDPPAQTSIAAGRAAT
jgi:hypothetical protein